MKTHNVVIYHCLCCGTVMHREPDQEAPQCCGRQMVKAAAETIFDRVGQILAADSETRTTSPRQGVSLPEKPR